MNKRLTSFLMFGFLFAMIVILLASSVYAPSIKAQGGGDDEDSGPPPYTTGVFPRAMAFDGERVWTANWVDNSITILDADTGEHIRTLEQDVVGEQPVALAWDGTSMWVAAFLDNEVYRMTVNGERREIFGPNQGVQQPVAMLFDGAHIWVVNQGTGARPGNVMKIVADTALLLGTFEVGHFPTAITWDGSSIWVANGGDNTVTVLSDDTGSRVGQVSVNGFPIALAYDGVHVWVAHYDSTIALIRNSSRQIDESVTLDEIPGRSINLMYAFERMWITNADDESIANFRSKTGVLLNTELAGQFPGAMVTTDDEVWVANWLDYKITVIDASEALTSTDNEAEAVAANPGLWLPSPVPTATPMPTPIPVCNADLPSRLKIGDRGQIDVEGSTADLRMREQPDLTQDNVIGAYPPLTQFTVLDGPVCVGEAAWFQVELVEDGTVGWFIEAIDDDYTIEPLPN